MDTDLFIDKLPTPSQLHRLYSLYKELYDYKTLLNKTNPYLLDTLKSEILKINKKLPYNIFTLTNNDVYFDPTNEKDLYIKLNNCLDGTYIRFYDEKLYTYPDLNNGFFLIIALCLLDINKIESLGKNYYSISMNMLYKIIYKYNYVFQYPSASYYSYTAKHLKQKIQELKQIYNKH